MLSFEGNVRAILECNFAGMKDELIDIATRRIVELKETPAKWIHRNDDHFDWLECPGCGYGDEGEVIIKRLEDAPSIYCPCCGQRLEGVK